MIAEILHKVAEMDHEPEHDFYPRPSSAGPEKCIRQMVYHGLGFAPRPLPGRSFHVFNDGHFHEDLTFDWIRKTTFQVHSEQMPVNCLPPMTKGKIDCIVTDLLGVDRLIEHKGLNHFTFQRYWNTDVLPLDNLTQTAIYMEATQRELNPDLKEGILLIKNKNTSQYMEFLVEYNRAQDYLHLISKTHSTGETEKIDVSLPEIVTGACKKFNDVLDYIKRKTLPKRQYDYDHWRCEYCQYNQVCWEGYEQEFNELKTDAMLPNEVADMLRYYKELGAQKKDISDEYDTLRDKVKAFMKDGGFRAGRAGEYFCELKLIKGSKIEKEKIPPGILECVSKPYFQERINIRKLKEATA